MSLTNAHEGYEYQDLLISYFILNEILDESESIFSIDKKMFTKDIFDDLTIENKQGIFKKQIKYSNESVKRSLIKDDLSAGNKQLALDDLFYSWNNYLYKDKCKITLCLAWDEPTDTLTEFVKKKESLSSFKRFNTITYQINCSKFWPTNGTPPSNWKRFTAATNNISRKDFQKFSKILNIEVNLPKFSGNFYQPGELEQIVFQQLEQIGLGVYPNAHRTKEEFGLSLVALVRRARGKGIVLDTNTVFKEFNLRTDYGSIYQEFPIIRSQNISRDVFTKELLNELAASGKVILIGEPGSGKSWFVENLREIANNSNIKVIRHLCYTDLDDNFQKDRIQLNVFYGNLIFEILDRFPSLKKEKKKRYASDLYELNELILAIKEKTILIIDGIDHIDRIYNFRNFNKELTKKDIDIISSILELKTSPFLKILIVSQPIPELDSINGFTRVTIPKWDIEDVTNYMAKNHVSETTLANQQKLSNFLYTKSAGNPLYLRYLISESRTWNVINLEKFNRLPDYNESLSLYYDYIVAKLALNEQLPRILSGVNFSLTREELKEITGEGDNIDDGLITLAPVVKLNISQNGYVIYHESFRRYILDSLNNKKVSVEKTIFNPIISWFEEKGFYEYTKSFRFYLQYLYDLNKTDKIVEFITKDYVTKSVFHGHSWNSIKSNYDYLLKASLKLKSFPKVILANEINKTLSSTEDEFLDSTENYLEALGHARGFKFVSQYLSYEGQPTLSPKAGLIGCYLCHTQGVSAPWDLYTEYFSENKGIELEDFKYYVRLRIIQEDGKELIRLSKKLLKVKDHNYIRIFLDEMTINSNIEFIENLKNKKEYLKVSAALTKKANYSKSEIDINNLVSEILKFTLITEREVSKIRIFLNYISSNTDNVKLLSNLEKKFMGRNWFYNWLRFIIQSELIKTKSSIEYSDIKKTLSILVQDTEPFKGNPRISDIHFAENIIFESILEFLKNIITTDDAWEEVIGILKKLSNETTVSYQRSLSGPLVTLKFLKLLSFFCTEQNVNKILACAEEEVKEKEAYHLHSDLADYHFVLSKLYSLKKDQESSIKALQKGVQYLFGYTFRKDITIGDLTESIISLNTIDHQMGKVYIKKLKGLVDSVVDHTDGKSTKHFPVSWFEKYTNIDLKESILYLREELLNSTYDWRLEESLQHVIKKTNGDINPIIELQLARTFILENNEDFLSHCVNIIEKAYHSDHQTAIRSLHWIIEKAKRRSNQGYSVDFIGRLKKILIEFGEPINPDCDKIKLETRYGTQDRSQKEKSASRKKTRKVSEMNISELTTYIEDNELDQNQIDCLVEPLKKVVNLNSDTKNLISSFYTKTLRYSNTTANTDQLFANNSDVQVYFWVMRYINDGDGWFSSLVNINAFKKAAEINKEKSLDFLFENLYEKLNLTYTSKLSANLINGLVNINYDDKVIRESWEILFNAIDYRLPTKDNYDWDKSLRNDLNMDNDELIICLIVLRLKVYTLERYELALAGISYILEKIPQKMINPLRWFFSNCAHFKKSIFLSILQILFDYTKENKKYSEHFRNDLQKLYPTNYFLIDAVIELLYSLPKRNLLIRPPIRYYPIEDDEARVFLLENYRNLKIAEEGIDIRSIFGKVKTNFSITYPFEKYLDIYFNRVHKIMVPNLFFHDYLLQQLNEDLYSELYQYDLTKIIVDDLKINVNLLISQTNSLTTRSEEVKPPSKILKDKRIVNEIDFTDGWRRIAHFEKELFDDDNYKLKENCVYAAISFDNDMTKFPLNLTEINLWKPEKNDPSKHVIYFYYQKDYLEHYKVLWLNPALLKKLGIEFNNSSGTINGINSKKEIVLKYNNWRTNYIGNGEFSRLSDEIPKLEGCELIIRDDYYQKLCKLFKSPPKYHLIKY